jgi:thiosulfate/3-mercaptopyruvate sulfurtransferase
MTWTTVVSCEALRERLGDPAVVVVDARYALGDPAAGVAAWHAARLPGARYVDLDRELSDHARPATEGRHPLPDAARFQETVAALGIGPGTQVVVYDAADGALAAARFWWMLKLVGHEAVAVLDGGFARWTALGYPVESGDAPAVVPAEVSSADYAHKEIVGTEELAERLGEAPGWLLDARAGPRYRGEVETLDRVAGHIPGALNRPYTDNLADGRFLPADVLRAQFRALIGERDPRGVVLHCGSGVTACHNLLAMEIAGLSGARIYAPSWSGWVADPSRPIANGPDP